MVNRASLTGADLRGNVNIAILGGNSSVTGIVGRA